jgi:hypothetical protein
MHELLIEDDDLEKSQNVPQFNQCNNHEVNINNAIHLDDFSQSFGLGNGPPQCLTFVNFNDFNSKTFTRPNTHPTPTTIVTI